MSSTTSPFDLSVSLVLNKFGSIRKLATSSLPAVNVIVSVALTAFPLGEDPSPRFVSDNVTGGTRLITGSWPSVRLRSSVEKLSSPSASSAKKANCFTMVSLLEWLISRATSKLKSPLSEIVATPSVNGKVCAASGSRFWSNLYSTPS